MGQVLYRKYRSKDLSEVLGQSHITTALNNALKNNRIAHAYLFTGPRGVGKTSTARILAHAVNNLPYNEDSNHIDIVEIDAASNNGVDEIRELREKAYITPTAGKYRVYIIDEVHMLSKPAFNALLKILEEPPEHVIFILATTETHKLPETIISRTQRFSFKPISNEDVIKHLKEIAQKERYKISDDAYRLLAEKGQGSFRDSISLLDQISSIKNDIEEEDVINYLGMPSERTISDVIDLLESVNPNYKQMSLELNKLYDQGFNPENLSKAIMGIIRRKLVEGELSLDKETTFKLLYELLEVSKSSDPKSKLILVLLSNLKTTDTIKVELKIIKEKKIEEPKKIIEEKIEPVVIEEEINLPDENLEKEAVKDIEEEFEVQPNGNWNDVLDELRKKQNTIHALVKSAKVTILDDEIILTFDYAFHQKKIDEIKNKAVLDKAIKKFFGKSMKIETRVDTNKKNNINKINEVFGAAEIEDI